MTGDAARLALLAGGVLGGDRVSVIRFLVESLTVPPDELLQAHAVARRAMLRGEEIPNDGYFGTGHFVVEAAEAVAVLAGALGEVQEQRDRDRGPAAVNDARGRPACRGTQRVPGPA